jgi:uncharacterized protein (DUF305 family)
MRELGRAVELSVVVLALAVGGPAAAQQPMTPANQEYKAAMEKMDKDMMAGMDADPTKAWVKMTIPHHQGLIDMSQTVLKNTKDPKIRKMAESGIKKQSKEIKELQDWLKKNGS